MIHFTYISKKFLNRFQHFQCTFNHLFCKRCQNIFIFSLKLVIYPDISALKTVNTKKDHSLTPCNKKLDHFSYVLNLRINICSNIHFFNNSLLTFNKKANINHKKCKHFFIKRDAINSQEKHIFSIIFIAWY